MPVSPRTNLRFEDEAYDRLSQVAEELKIDRTEVVRVLVLPVLGVATPVEEHIGELVRQVAARRFGQTVAA